jgi:hypothetical protein
VFHLVNLYESFLGLKKLEKKRLKKIKTRFKIAKAKLK